MGHTWKAVITHSNGTSTITFADGDDVSVTPYIGLVEPPSSRPELNVPKKAELRVRNVWNVAARNVMSSSCALWSGGATGAIVEGMRLQVWHVDAGNGTEYQTFDGRIKSVSADRTVVLTAYDDLMILGETKDPFAVFSAMRDRVGDASVANGPDITTTMDYANERLTASLPDGGAVQPLVRVAVAIPTDVYPDLINESPSDYLALSYGRAQCFFIPDGKHTYFRFKFTYKWADPSSIKAAQIVIMSTTYTGGRYNYSAVVAGPLSLTIAGTDGKWMTAMTTVDVRNLTPGRVYAIGIYPDSPPVTDIYFGMTKPWSNKAADVWYKDSGGVWQLGDKNDGVFSMTPMALVDEEISADQYTITPGTPDSIVIPFTSFDRSALVDGYPYNKWLRVSYYYGKLTRRAVMAKLITRAANAAVTEYLPGGIESEGSLLGFYYTGTRSYLECMQELADLVDPSLATQAVLSHIFSTSMLHGTIGVRDRPWVASPVMYFTNDPMAVESSTRKRVIASHALKRAFEAKVGTVRIIGKAPDGSPISVEVDDKLWSDSLVNRTGSPLMEIAADSTCTSHAQAVLQAEALLAKQHQNVVEGTLELEGFWPSLWEWSTSDGQYGSSKVFALDIPEFGLSDVPVIARAISFGKHRTTIDLDSVRPADTTMVKRGLNSALRAESFSVSSLPDTVYIYVRAPSLPAGYAAYDRIKIRRADGTWFYTTDLGTKLATADDKTGGSGYRHWSGFFPAGRANSPSSYKWTGSAGQNHLIDQVAVGDGTNWTTIALEYPQAKYVLWHQNVLVNVRGPRP